MPKWCTCERCQRHNGDGKFVARSTWYTHNPGGKKGARRAEEEWGRLDADSTRGDSPRDSESSLRVGKGPVEEDIDTSESVKRLARSDSVRSPW